VIKKESSKILFVSHKYPPSTGGMQKQSYELIYHASQMRECETILYRSNYPKIFFFLFVTVRAFIKVINDPEIRLVHANDGLMALFLTPLLSIKRLNLGATIHGLDVVFNSAPYQFWVRQWLSKFTFLVAVSEATKEECIQRGIPKDRVFYIPNAVELPDMVDKDPDFEDWITDNYQITLNDKFIISSVGRPVPRKGFGWFATEVLPEIDKSRYLVVGTEMESSWAILMAKRILPRSLFESICKMLGVPLDTIKLSELVRSDEENKTILLGKIPQDKLIQVYLHSDMFVMPNFHVKGDFEGFGLVALEAGSLGAVCLAANVDGIPSAIKDGKNGFLIESKDKAEWIRKIQFLRKGNELELAKKNFANYFQDSQITWEAMSKEYVKLFDQFSS